ncbi:MAG: hypothetical protein ACFFD4_38910 [Candidatus Odinarchaeota archaeon]
MHPKFPHEKTAVNDLEKLDGFQLLDQFELKASHILTQDEASVLWKFLKHYLWEEEEEELFVSWEHFKFGRGEHELIGQIDNIRERMKKGLHIKEIE